MRPLLQRCSEGEDSTFHQVKELVAELLSERQNLSDENEELIFVGDKVFTFDPRKVSEAKDFDELLVFLNECADVRVQLVSEFSLREIRSKGDVTSSDSAIASRHSVHSLEEEKMRDSPSKKKRLLEIH